MAEEIRYRGRTYTELEFDEIRDNQLGWDITDFGQGRFEELGLVVFTIRNGNKLHAAPAAAPASVVPA